MQLVGLGALNLFVPISFTCNEIGAEYLGLTRGINLITGNEPKLILQRMPFE